MPENFTLGDVFGPNPARPSHPDFWRLSEIVLGLDASMSGATTETEVEEIISKEAAKIGDAYSVCYVAVQRAMRAHGASTVGEVHADLTAILRSTLMYMEGMIVGARLTQSRNG